MEALSQQLSHALVAKKAHGSLFCIVRWNRAANGGHVFGSDGVGTNCIAGASSRAATVRVISHRLASRHHLIRKQCLLEVIAIKAVNDTGRSSSAVQQDL